MHTCLCSSELAPSYLKVSTTGIHVQIIQTITTSGSIVGPFEVHIPMLIFYNLFCQAQVTFELQQAFTILLSPKF